MMTIDEYRKKVAYKPIYQLRGLDFDDLYIMYYFGKGFQVKEIAKIIGLTLPCVTARKHKVQRSTGILLWEYNKQKVQMTDEGKQLCALATKAIEVFTSVWHQELVEVSRTDPKDQQRPKNIKNNQGYLAGDI